MRGGKKIGVCAFACILTPSPFGHSPYIPCRNTGGEVEMYSFFALALILWATQRERGVSVVLNSFLPFRNFVGILPFPLPCFVALRGVLWNSRDTEQSIDYRLSPNLYKQRAAINFIAALCRMGFLFMNFYPLCRGFSCIALLCGFYDGFGKLLER